MKKVIIDLSCVDNSEIKSLINYLDCEMWDYVREGNSIEVNPHFCSTDEYNELISYINEECWSYTQKENTNA